MDLFSSLIGSGAIGGSSAKRDRAEQLNSYTDFRNVFNNAFGFGQGLENTGTRTTGQGTSDLGTAGNFFRKLTSGNRTATAQAMAPQTNAVNQQGDTERRQEAALGTARGGGTAGFNQDAQARRMAQIDNMLFGAQTGAAGELANIGRTEAGVGLGETGQGLQAENIARETATNLGNEALESRGLSDKLHRQSTSDIANGISSTLTDVFKMIGLG